MSALAWPLQAPPPSLSSVPLSFQAPPPDIPSPLLSSRLLGGSVPSLLPPTRLSSESSEVEREGGRLDQGGPHPCILNKLAIGPSSAHVQPLSRTHSSLEPGALVQCTTYAAVHAGPDKVCGPWSRSPHRQGSHRPAVDKGYNRYLGDQGGGEPSCAQCGSSREPPHPAFTSSVRVGRGGRHKPLRK